MKASTASNAIASQNKTNTSLAASSAKLFPSKLSLYPACYNLGPKDQDKRSFLY